MQSGVTGINQLRVYNPLKQSREQDPDGVFLRTWLPELADVPTPLIHEPWTMSASEQADAGCEIGKHYPAPLVDPVKAARAAREKVAAVRKSAGFGDGQKQVLQKHASRKRQRTEIALKPDSQLDFDF